MKRKFIDRDDWKRVLKKRYVQKYFDREGFKGYVSALYIEKVKQPLIKHMLGRDYCIADAGYIWLQHLPIDKNYAITTMYDSDDKIVQWYFDIIKANGVIDGRPYFDDLYLDVVLLPNGQVLLLDEDELLAALSSADIDKNDYDMAYKEAKAIVNYVSSHVKEVTDFSNLYLKEIKSLIMGQH